MKRIIFLLFFGICMVHLVKAQVKIGENPQSLDGASVLELESTDKVLVITRVSTAEMNAITPLQGALVYNTDVQSVHYYDGTQWVNIGGSGSTDGPLTADPIVNDISTIVITPTGTGNNLEVAENSIGTTQIRDFSINGTEDILDGSIGTGKFGEDVITQFELSENSVGPIELDNANIGVSAFTNDVGYITSANVVSLDGGNALQVGTDDGAYYDETPLINAIQDNTDAINLDNDANPNNEIQNLQLNGNDLTISGSNTVTLPSTTGEIDDNELITDAVLNGTDLVITEAGTDFTVPLASLSGGGGSTEVADQTTITGVGTAGDPFKIEPGGNGQFLTTDGTGAVSWETVTPGGGTTEVVDGTLLTGAGTAGDPFTIAPGGADQILRTNPAGDAVTWVPLPTGGAVISDNTLDGDGSSIATALGLADNAVTLEKIAPNGATTDGQIIQWNTDLDGPGPGTDAGWELGASTTITGTADHIFFADATTGEPVVSANGGLLWDPTSRFGTGALFVGLDGFTQSKSTEAKVQILENLNGQLAYPLQIQNRAVETAVNPSAVGMLFAVERAGDHGKGSLVFERMTTTGSGDFHFLQDTDNDNANPALDTDKAFTITEDKDIRLYRGIDIDGVGFGTAGQVLASGGFENKVQWVNPSGLPAGTDEWDIVTWEPDLANPTNSTYISSKPQSVKLDVANNKIDLLRGNGTAINSSIQLDNITLEAANIGADVIRIKPGAISAATPKDRILVTDKDTGNVGWEDLPDSTLPNGGTNLQMLTTDGAGTLSWTYAKATEVTLNPALDLDNDLGTPDETNVQEAITTLAALGGNLFSVNNLVLAANRTHDLNNNNLVFGGSGNIAIGTLPGAPQSKLDVDGQIQARIGFASNNGSVGEPGYSFSAESSTGMYRPGVGQLGLVSGGNEALRIIGNQNVGIGLTNPAETLHVNGSIRTENVIKNIIGGVAAPSYTFEGDLNTGMYSDGADVLNFSTAGIEVLYLGDDQRVGIGTNTPARKLHVAGDLQVDTEIWIGGTQVIPDYVFQKYFLGSSELKSDYEFKSLQAIEAFVKRYKHLPGIKSAQQVKDEGVWNLSESNIQNLEKIEELFLHTIEQEHKIKTLQSENQNLSEELQSLKRDLEEIKALLKNN